MKVYEYCHAGLDPASISINSATLDLSRNTLSNAGMSFLLPVLAYLMGSISSAVLAARLFGMPDPRTVGSGNPGATNVLRQGNKAAAAATLVGDVIKGTLPVLIARWFTSDPGILALVAVTAFLGHLYPVFFGFKGGKGVATALGVFLGLNPWMGLALIATWLVVALVFRYSSLAAVVTALCAIAYSLYFLPGLPYLLATTVIAAMLIWRHRTNLQRLFAGDEDKIKLRRGT